MCVCVCVCVFVSVGGGLVDVGVFVRVFHHVSPPPAPYTLTKTHTQTHKYTHSQTRTHPRTHTHVSIYTHTLSFFLLLQKDAFGELEFELEDTKDKFEHVGESGYPRNEWTSLSLFVSLPIVLVERIPFGLAVSISGFPNVPSSSVEIEKNRTPKPRYNRKTVSRMLADFG